MFALRIATLEYMAATRNIHPRQFGLAGPVEYSREGAPKRPHPTREAAQAVADQHTAKYGTVAKPYQGRDKQWYVTTDRRATADAQYSEQSKRRVERMVSLQMPIVASDVQTRKVKHVGTGQSLETKLTAMNPKSPLHGQWQKWVANHPMNQPR